MGISKQDIQVRSYLIWEQQGCPQGKEKEHWYLAERQLAAEQADPKKARSKSTAASGNRTTTNSKKSASAKRKTKVA